MFDVDALGNYLKKRLTNRPELFALEAPIADVVEVVRCKDCMFNKGFLKFGDLHCGILEVPMKNDDFCSYGKRRNDEAD